MTFRPTRPKRPQPPPPPPPPAPPPPKPPPSDYVIGSVGNASIDQWDDAFVAASEAVLSKRGVRVNPRFIKAMMVVETGGNGNLSPHWCRPSDGTDNVAACGPMQIKFPYHKHRCLECNLQTVPGQIALAAHIIGAAMKEKGLDEYGALLAVYFPHDDINGNTQHSYVTRVRQLIAAMEKNAGVTPPPPKPAPPPPTGLQPHTLAGSLAPLWLPDDVAFSVILTELDHVARPNDRRLGANRSGTPMRWSGVTQHTTNNTTIGTDAMSHSRWQDTGTQGHPNGRIGVHFYVDDKRVVQKIPVNEQGVHSGDWRNQAHAAVELCVNADRNAARAERNSQALCAGLLAILGTTAEKNLYPHTTNAQGHCPRLSVSWSQWEREVDARLREMRSGSRV